MAEGVLIPDSLVRQLVALSARRVWSDYDAQADVLYISFRKPQQANDSIMEADGNIYHYRDDEVVGVTIPHASRKGHEVLE
jgi:uncharacterized protein YuzE